MNKTIQKRKRRGLMLSSSGLQRLQDAQEQSAIRENDGYAYTLEELSNLTGLSVRSITRLQSCKVAVDRQTLEEFFRAFKLTLSEQDYIQPEVVAAERQFRNSPRIGEKHLMFLCSTNAPPNSQCSPNGLCKPIAD